MTSQRDSTLTPAPVGSILHAWVDESIHTPGSGTVEGMYVLAAAVAEPAGCEVTREALRALVPRNQDRLHWRHEDEPRRGKIAAAIAAAGLANVVVIGTRLDAGNQERARRKCMERLLWELEVWRVSQVWLESRTRTLNRKDMKLVDAWRSQGKIRGLRVDFELPSVEPMLWVPDAVAGACAAARKGTSVHRVALGEMVHEVELQL